MGFFCVLIKVLMAIYKATSFTTLGLAYENK